MKLVRYCKSPYSLIALMFVMSFLLLSLTVFTKAKQTKGSAHESVVILDVQQNADTIFISPVALFERGQFSPPYSKINGDLPRRRFVEKYFSSGQKYHLIFGSGDGGTLTISNGYWQDGSYAYGELAPVAAVGGRIKGQLHALATNSETAARSSIWRRSPTADERAAAIGLAKEAFLQNKTPATALSSMEVINLTAIDVDGDDQAELVGTFKVPQARADKPPHWLFLIGEADNQGSYKATKVDYQFHPEQTQYPLGEEMFVDYLDIDGDGTGEVVTRFTVHDFFEIFEIYQRKNRKWLQIFTGGGSH